VAVGTRRHSTIYHLSRLGTIATQQGLTATSHHNGVQVLCDLAARGPDGLSATIHAIHWQTGDPISELADRVGVDPGTFRRWEIGYHTPPTDATTGSSASAGRSSTMARCWGTRSMSM
jgi:transcriptional regulator with XRE-family HTH domain